MCSACSEVEQGVSEVQEVELDNRMRAHFFSMLPAAMQSDTLREEFFQMTVNECRQFLNGIVR